MDTSDVRRNEAESRYELAVDGELAGLIDYREGDGALDLLHTEVQPAYEGRGLAARLVAGALADARERGLRVVPSCSYVAAYLRRHPQEAAHPG